MSDNPAEPIRQETVAGSTPQAVPTTTPKVPALGILILTTLLGCLVPYLVVTIQENSYEKLFFAPEKATEILAENYVGLYIRTAEGKVFLCSFERDGLELISALCSETIMENVPEAPDSRLSQWPCSNLPPAPGKVIAYYEDCTPPPDGTSSRRWVILDDGSVWSWSLTCAMFGCAAPTIFLMLLGAGVGFLVGVVIVAALGSRRKSREGQLTETNASAAPADEGTTP